MDFVRKLTRPLTPLITLAFLSLSLVVPVTQAKMINTETMVNKHDINQKREKLLKTYKRQDVRKVMQSYGISPKEAQSRINSLTAQEVLSLSKRIDKMPAGAGPDGLLLLVLILVILEATGVTNIFTFM